MKAEFFRRAALALAATALMTLGAQDASAERNEPLVLRLGALGSGSEHDFMAYPIKAFMAEVEEKTSGKVSFQYFPGGQLGGEPQMLDQVLSETLDIGILSANVVATVWPQLSAYNLPFAFSNVEEFWKVAGDDQPFAVALRDVVNASGNAHMVASFSADFRGLQNTKRPVRSPADLQGLKLRVMAGEIFSDTFQALGASTTAVSFAELYTSLQQGVIDGEDLVSSMFYDVKLYEVEKHLTQVNMTPNVNVLLMSSQAWGKLSEEEREIVEAAAFNAEKVSKETILRFEVEYPKLLEELGVNVVYSDELSDAEKKAFRDAVQPIWEKYRPIIGDEIYSLYEQGITR